MSQNTFDAGWKVSMDSGNGLVPLGKKQLSKPMLNHGFINHFTNDFSIVFQIDEKLKV